MLLGQSSTGMQVYDLVRASQAISTLGELNGRPQLWYGEGASASRVILAAVMTDSKETVRVDEMPETYPVLNFSRYFKKDIISQLLEYQSP